MGRYCCCSVKINSYPYECDCDWDGWVTFTKDKPTLELPKKDGLYQVRYGDNGGDKYEGEWFFSVKCLEEHQLMYSDRIYKKHWEHESCDDYYVYAWRELTKPLKIE